MYAAKLNLLTIVRINKSRTQAEWDEQVEKAKLKIDAFIQRVKGIKEQYDLLRRGILSSQYALRDAGRGKSGRYMDSTVG